jgi:hypothetical protein
MNLNIVNSCMIYGWTGMLTTGYTCWARRAECSREQLQCWNNKEIDSNTRTCIFIIGQWIQLPCHIKVIVVCVGFYFVQQSIDSVTWRPSIKQTMCCKWYLSPNSKSYRMVPSIGPWCEFWLIWTNAAFYSGSQDNVKSMAHRLEVLATVTHEI